MYHRLHVHVYNKVRALPGSYTAHISSMVTWTWKKSRKGVNRLGGVAYPVLNVTAKAAHNLEF